MKRIVSIETNQKVQSQLSSPRAAAVAGILFSLLMFTVMIMTNGFTQVNPKNMVTEWTETWSGTASQVITMVSFAGIAFLWFTGVVRDRLGDQEDQFFSTIFLSSGIIMVLLFFFWGAILGAILSTEALLTIKVASHLYIFAFTLMNEIFGNYALRVASIYMISICTLWTKTGLMPRWLTVLTYILAFGFLFTANMIREARYIFPAWVLLVSVYILYLNYLGKQQPLSSQDVTETN
jgi:hypothetical protein